MSTSRLLAAGTFPVIRRVLGSKLQRMGFASADDKAASGRLVQVADTPPEQRNRYSLTDADVIELARYALVIEKHYGRPMDIEWGKDGIDGKLYILQARPETVKSQAAATTSSTATSSRATAARTPCWPKAAPSARRSAPGRCAWCAARPRWTACSPATCSSPT